MTLQWPEGSKPDRRTVLKALAVATLPKLTHSFEDLQFPPRLKVANSITCSKANQEFFNHAFHLNRVPVSSLPASPSDLAVAERSDYILQLRNCCLAAIRQKHGDNSLIARTLQSVPVEYDPTEEGLIAESVHKIKLNVKSDTAEKAVIKSDHEIYKRFGSQGFFAARPPFYLRSGADGLQAVPGDGRITIDQLLSGAADENKHPSGRHQYTSCAVARVAFSCVAIGSPQECGPIFFTDYAFESGRITIELAEVLLHEYLHALQIKGGFSFQNKQNDVLAITPELLNQTMGIPFSLYPQTIELFTEIQAYAFAHKITKGIESREAYNKERLKLSLLKVERSSEIIAPRNPSLYRELVQSLANPVVK